MPRADRRDDRVRDVRALLGDETQYRVRRALEERPVQQEIDAPKYLVAGERLWNGAEVSHSLATAYNRLTDKIEQFKAKGRRVPEELLNGRHNLIASA